MSITYIGTYTQHLPHVAGKAAGILIYRFDSATGALHEVGVAGGVTNPSFVTFSSDRRFLYAVQEIGEYAGKPGGAVSAFAVDTQSGSLTLLNTQATHGAHPCFASVDASGRWLLVANYSGGNVAVLPIAEDGSLGAATHVVDHIGVPTHHDAPHPHAIWHDPHGRWVLVPDCGLDRIAVYQLDAERGILTPNNPPWVMLAPGAGPRHLAFHPQRADLLYCINERNSTLTTFAYDAARGVLTELQTLSTLPDSFSGSNSCADLHVHASGRFVYGSNRGHDSIAIFACDTTNGMLTLLGHQSTGGRTPRNFAIDPSGTWLLAANQDSDSIQSMQIDPASGMLSAGPITPVASPVCVLVLSKA